MPPRLTLETLNKRLEPLNISVIGDYTAISKKARFRCAHGHEWTNYVCAALDKGIGCPYCAGRAIMPDDLATGIAARRVDMLDDFVRMTTKNTFRCWDCDHKWTVQFHVIWYGRAGCPSCAGILHKTREELNELLIEQGVPFVLLDEPVNTKTPTRVKALQCGHEFVRSFDQLRTRKACPICAGTERTSAEVNQLLAPRGIVLLGEYRGAVAPARFLRIACGHEWESTCSSVLGGSGCLVCRGFHHSRQSINIELAPRGIVMIDDYAGRHTAVRFACAQDHVWRTTIGTIKRGSGCPVCANIGIFCAPVGYVYVMSYSNGLVKIGSSSDPQRRRKELLKATREGIEIVAQYQFGNGTGRAAWEAEQLAHENFREKRAGLTGFDGSTELFRITPGEACQWLLDAGGNLILDNKNAESIAKQDFHAKT
ncbi:GIY-YIG nuclease family protein [Salmonella enterica]|nr:GIY-YIG nuclease family protein [Salmonella enterica]EHA9546187.1 GIY-YIG nuclease family protein [Salmonella enterica subsp. enterica serovar Braenderup]EBH4941568.1 GIY-YIG nuclease family protein [Salmonella enterica]ECK3278492.1 GIY-YIG nuclease family protein [Salmonella enterica]ECK6358160.1 GIY-YIG nuclease family protein [Salmonella enterica]